MSDKLGNKHECPSCGTKFYDLGKPEPVCPRCGTAPEDPDVLEAKSSRARKSRPTAKVPYRRSSESDDDEIDDEIGGIDDEAVEADVVGEVETEDEVETGDDDEEEEELDDDEI